MRTITASPIIGICGFKNSGKTTLAESLAARLKAEGLNVGYIKHDAHTFQMDHEGKDTYKLFNAGTDAVCINNATEAALRLKQKPQAAFRTFMYAQRQCDLILMEGYKESAYPKIWVSREDDGGDCPSNIVNVIARLCPGKTKTPDIISRDNLKLITEIIINEAEKQIKNRPVYGGILIGGKSRRMGKAKSLIKAGSLTLAERAHGILSGICDKTFFLGKGPLPQNLEYVSSIPDYPFLRGPVSGMFSAFNFCPLVDWLFVAVDMPFIAEDFLKYIMSRRKIGYKASVHYNKSLDRFEPLCGLYSPELLATLETSVTSDNYSLQPLLRGAGVRGFTNLPNPDILTNWNTPQDMGQPGCS